MNLSKLKFNLKSKNPNHGKIGKDPSTDWFIILCVFTLVSIIAIATTVVRFLNTKSFIASLDSVTGVSNQNDTKTQEEQVNEILDFYRQKSDRHNQLLGKSKVESKQDIQAVEAEARKQASTTPGVGTENRAGTTSGGSGSNRSQNSGGQEELKLIIE